MAITVGAINHAPSFTKGADQVSGMMAIAQSVPNWATAISPGPASEAGQSVTFLVTTNNPNFFAVQPTISPNGNADLYTAGRSERRGAGDGAAEGQWWHGEWRHGYFGGETFTIAACEFDSNLTGWTTAETGGSGAGKGTVTVVDRMAKLTEGNSFSVSLSKPFVVPAGPSKLTFEYESLSFDTASGDLMNDAFEVAFVNEQGLPLVMPYADGHDAFFNVSEGVAAALGSGVTVNGSQVTVDLSSVAAGSTGRLLFRLVNNDTDVTTSVEICAAWLKSGTGVTNLVAPTSSGNSNAGGTPVNSSLPSGNTNSRSVGIGEGVHSLPANSNSGTPSSTSNNSGAASGGDLPIVSLASLPASAFSVDSRGTDFWLGFNANLHEGGQPVTKTLFITGDVATTGTVEIPGLSYSMPFVVNPGQVTSVVLPDASEVLTVSVIEQKGIHVTANDPVSVYGLNRELATTDAFLGLPTTALGQDYVNLTYKNTGKLLAFVAGTQMLVVGTQDNTSVTIGPGPYSPATNMTKRRIFAMVRGILRLSYAMARIANRL